MTAEYENILKDFKEEQRKAKIKYNRLAAKLSVLGKHRENGTTQNWHSLFFAKELDKEADDGTGYYINAWKEMNDKDYEEFTDFQIGLREKTPYMAVYNRFYGDMEEVFSVWRPNLNMPMDKRPKNIEEFLENQEFIEEYDWDFSTKQTQLFLYKAMEFGLFPTGETPEEEKETAEVDFFQNFPDWTDMFDENLDLGTEGTRSIFSMANENEREDYLRYLTRLLGYMNNRVDDYIRACDACLDIYKFMKQKAVTGVSRFIKHLEKNGYYYNPEEQLTPEKYEVILEGYNFYDSQSPKNGIFFYVDE